MEKPTTATTPARRQRRWLTIAMPATLKRRIERHARQQHRDTSAWARDTLAAALDAALPTNGAS